MRKTITFAFLSFLLASAGLAKDDKASPPVTVSHPDFELRIHPRESGRCELFFKKGGLYPADKKPQSLFRECFFAKQMENGFQNQPYQCSTTKNGPITTVTLKRVLIESECGVDLAGVELQRVITIDPSKSTIAIDVIMKNSTGADRYIAFGVKNRFRIEKFKENLTYAPTTRCVLELTKNGMVWGYYARNTKWEYEPVAGWLAVNDPKRKKGLGFSFDYNVLESLYVAESDSVLGWYYDGGPLPDGQQFKTSYYVVPFNGLDTVSFLSKDVVIGVKPPKKGKRNVSVSALSPESKAIVLDLETKIMKTGESQSLGKLNFELKPKQVVTKTVNFPSTPDSACDIIAQGEIGGSPIILHQYVENGFHTQPIFALPLNIPFTTPKPEKRRLIEEASSSKPIKREKKALIFYGIYTQHYHLDKVFEGWDVILADSPPARTKLIPPATTIDQYSVIVLSDINAGCLPGIVVNRLKRYVKNGGALLVLGGPYAYGQGNYQTSGLDEMLPVESAFFDLQPEKSVKKIVSKRDDIKIESPLSFYWRHRCPVKKNGNIWLSDGKNPILVVAPYGKGMVGCFLTAPLGKAKSGERPFWETATWIGTMKQATNNMIKHQSGK